MQAILHETSIILEYTTKQQSDVTLSHNVNRTDVPQTKLITKNLSKGTLKYPRQYVTHVAQMPFTFINPNSSSQLLP